MSNFKEEYYILDPQFTSPANLNKERAKAKKLKKTQWWLTLLNRGICHYCQEKFSPHQLTLDHIVPIARGGKSMKGNLVPACRECNQGKKLKIPVENLF